MRRQEAGDLMDFEYSIYACGLPPNPAESLWLSGAIPSPFFPETQPQERLSLSGRCSGKPQEWIE
jgi:hypothetical protein